MKTPVKSIIRPIVAFAVVSAVVGTLSCGAPGQTNGTTAPDTQRQEIDTYSRQLVDPARTPQTKLEAAKFLLSKNYPQAATDALVGFLGDPTNQAARVAVARAIADTGRGRQEFVQPLFDMLTDADATVRAAAAEALTTFKNNGVLDRLTELVKDAKADQQVRLACISALSRVLDKKSIDALLGLLDDAQPNLNAAAAKALADLTGIRSFGSDAAAWRNWWNENKDKTRQQWLEDRADSLAKRNAALELSIARLRDSLERAMADRYAVTAPNDQPALLLGYLKDPLPEVRHSGLKLTDLHIRQNGKVLPATAEVVRGLLADADGRVRAAAATLTGTQNDAQAAGLLLKGLDGETSADVRQAIIAALGVLKVRAAVGPVLESITREPDATVIAAARAIQQLVDGDPLGEAEAAHAVEVLTARYDKSDGAEPALREALLGAMGALGAEPFGPVMVRALADKAPSIRVAALRGLQDLADPRNTQAVAQLLNDPDKGVRMTAIGAFAALGGQEQLDTILARSTAADEDATVRQRAWEAAMSLLGKAPVEKVSTVAESLASQPEFADQRIAVLELLVSRLADKPAAQNDARLQWAGALLARGRPGDAAKQFALAYKALAAEPGKAGPVWLDWTRASLASDDETCVARLDAQPDAQLLSDAMGLLIARLDEQVRAEAYLPAIAIGGSAAKTLKAKLSKEQADAIDQLVATARAAQQKIEDQTTVKRLVQQLAGSPETAGKAQADLSALKDRAVEPLLHELRQVASANPSNEALESKIAGVLAAVAPDLTGYDTKASPDEKLRLLDDWLAKISG